MFAGRFSLGSRGCCERECGFARKEAPVLVCLERRAAGGGGEPRIQQQ